MQELIWTRSIVTPSVVHNLKAFSKSAKMLTLNYSSNQLKMPHSMYSGIWPMKRKTSTNLMPPTLISNCLKSRINNLVERQQPRIEVAKQQSLVSTPVHQNQDSSPVCHQIRNKEKLKKSSSKPKPSL